MSWRDTSLDSGRFFGETWRRRIHAERARMTALSVVLLVSAASGNWAAAQPGRQRTPNTNTSSPASGAAPARAEGGSTNAQNEGLAVTGDDRLRIRLDVLAADYTDLSQAALGHNHQGRIGWIIVGLSGRLGQHASYLLEINPVNDAATPLPACGEQYFFFPNVPDGVGPKVDCVPDGRDRVDMYRFVGLDPITQQGSVRQAVLNLQTASGSLGVRVGRFIVPIGFRWDEVGSWTNHDATFIQRLNAEANFGVDFYGQYTRNGLLLADVHVSFIHGDGNRSREYSYSAFVNEAWDTNPFMTGVLSGGIRPVKGLEVRLSGKYGYSGSKVERYPSFYLSKRNDQGFVASVRYRPAAHLQVFGEYAIYNSGLLDSSAQLIGLTPSKVLKPGFYVGGDVSWPLSRRVRVGVVVTEERLSRNDSLVWFLAAQHLYHVSLGKQIRSTVIRAYANLDRYIQVGFYRNNLHNPFPWVSGIAAVAGPRAFQSRGDHKYGLVLRIRLP